MSPTEAQTIQLAQARRIALSEPYQARTEEQINQTPFATNSELRAELIAANKRIAELEKSGGRTRSATPTRKITKGDRKITKPDRRITTGNKITADKLLGMTATEQRQLVRSCCTGSKDAEATRDQIREAYRSLPAGEQRMNLFRNFKTIIQ